MSDRPAGTATIAPTDVGSRDDGRPDDSPPDLSRLFTTILDRLDEIAIASPTS